MKSPVWSKVLGVVLGILIGAGVVYAATYEYRVEVPSGVTVASEVETVPGLQVNPTTLDFGEVAPGQSSGGVSIQVTNIGDRGLSLCFDITDLPVGVTMYVNRTGYDSTWHACPYAYGGILNPGNTWTYGFYLECAENVTENAYNFTTVIREQ